MRAAGQANVAGDSQIVAVDMMWEQSAGGRAEGGHKQ